MKSEKHKLEKDNERQKQEKDQELQKLKKDNELEKEELKRKKETKAFHAKSSDFHGAGNLPTFTEPRL